MTAGKNQAQPIILQAVLFIFIGAFRRTPLRFEIAHELVLGRIKSCPSTQSINGFESGRRNQPWSRVAGYSTPRPQAQRRRKGFVHRLLGKIKITEQADQSCQDSSRIHAIKGVEQFAYLLGGTFRHDDDLSKPAIPNQFSKRRIDAKCPGCNSEIWTTEHSKSPMRSFELRTSSTLPHCSRVTSKPEGIRVRRPLVRNRDSLSPLACIAAVPSEWFCPDFTFRVHAMIRMRDVLCLGVNSHYNHTSW